MWHRRLGKGVCTREYSCVMEHVPQQRKHIPFFSHTQSIIRISNVRHIDMKYSESDFTLSKTLSSSLACSPHIRLSFSFFSSRRSEDGGKPPFISVTALFTSTGDWCSYCTLGCQTEQNATGPCALATVPALDAPLAPQRTLGIRTPSFSLL